MVASIVPSITLHRLTGRNERWTPYMYYIPFLRWELRSCCLHIRCTWWEEHVGILTASGRAAQPADVSS